MFNPFHNERTRKSYTTVRRRVLWIESLLTANAIKVKAFGKEGREERMMMIVAHTICKGIQRYIVEECSIISSPWETCTFK